MKYYCIFLCLVVVCITILTLATRLAPKADVIIVHDYTPDPAMIIITLFAILAAFILGAVCAVSFFGFSRRHRTTGETYVIEQRMPVDRSLPVYVGRVGTQVIQQESIPIDNTYYPRV